MIAHTGSKRSILGEADPVMRPHRVVDIEPEHLVSLVRARRDLDHRDTLTALRLGQITQPTTDHYGFAYPKSPHAAEE